MILSGPYLWNHYSQRLQIECAAWSCGLILHCCLPSNSLRYFFPATILSGVVFHLRGIAPRLHTGRPRTCLVYLCSTSLVEPTATAWKSDNGSLLAICYSCAVEEDSFFQHSWFSSYFPMALMYQTECQWRCWLWGEYLCKSTFNISKNRNCYKFLTCYDVKYLLVH